jgi:hypothetical protein
MRHLRRPIAFLLLIWYLPACMAGGDWQQHTLTPQDGRGELQGDFYVDLQDGSRYRFARGLWVSSDSLGGELWAPDDETAGAQRSYSLREVHGVFAWEPAHLDGVKTAGLVVLTTAATIALIAGMVAAANMRSPLECTLGGC